MNAVFFLLLFLTTQSAVDPDVKSLVKFDYGSAQPIRDKNGRCIRVKVGEPGLFISKVPERSIKNGEFHMYKGPNEANEKKLVRGAFEDGDIFFNYGDVLVQDENYFLYFKDRIGDTFRRKGENVSTTEVANVLTSLSFMEDANVYGVIIPEYAQPLFVRVLDQAIITGTFKQRKVELVGEAFDLDKVKNPSISGICLTIFTVRSPNQSCQSFCPQSFDFEGPLLLMSAGAFIYQYVCVDNFRSIIIYFIFLV